jgi:hypothetical protein
MFNQATVEPLKEAVLSKHRRAALDKGIVSGKFRGFLSHINILDATD